MGAILLMAVLFAPNQTFAFVGFNGAILPSTLNVCSGNQASITFTPTTCFSGVGPDWSANYIVDSSSDGVAWFPPVIGTTSGTISAASPTFTYLSSVFVTATSFNVLLQGASYRYKLVIVPAV